MKTIIHNRYRYYANSTIGEIFIEGKRFCYTLEDTVRAHGIKVQNNTAIPANNYYGYKVDIRHSPSFNRDMLILYNLEDKETLSFGGITFKYVYAHGGNTNADTDGCILVAKNKGSHKVNGVLEGTIQGSMEHELFKIVSEWLSAGEEVIWLVTNFKQEK